MLKDNLIILKEYYPKLYERIIELEDNDNIQEVKSKNGMSNIIFNNKFWIHSRYNPENEALKWIDNTIIKDEDTILVIGLGLGYYLEKLEKKYKDKKIIIIEPNIYFFRKMLDFKDITKFLRLDNIVFMVDIDPYIIRRLISDYLKENKIKKIHIEEMPIYRKIDNKYIEQLYKEIDNGLFQIKGNIATEIAFAQMWLNNTIRLLDYIKEIPDVSIMKEEFKDIPIVIVSAGPSLNKNVHYLKEINNKALIIAVGSAVNILEKKEITPHIIMGFDGQEMEAKIFQQLKNTKPIFIFGPSVHYKAVESYKGQKMCMILNNDTSILELYKGLGIKVQKFDSGPSVSNIALVLAQYLKASQVMLIGQDLAYTGNERYAEGGIHNYNIDKDKSLERKGFKKVLDIYGKEVYTKNDLIGIKNWFEEYLNVFNGEIEVYNCSEAGLGIKGAPNMKFKEAINKFCIRDFNIYDKLPLLSKKNNSIDKDKFGNLIFEYKKEIKRLIELSKQRLDKIYKLINHYDEKSFSKQFKSILNLCDEIEKYDSFKVFIEPTGKSYIDSITSGINNKLDKLDNIHEKNKTILNGLALQYEYIDKCMQIVKFAFDKKDIDYSS
ncbi:motility associated factor glycosyltransferase family protein [Clostridium taeniosporum]|uniref:DUF115 domain-containing protein n=1 Tax=Clostridium taeniosporum TaxID=394958 RepID=A0A1D7XIA2_9CLOT|nr:6-hydroxymethylpterin diphosphokinase MptE-like protein [Clostridium taeniosporum]AOR22910.1 DUF115 domain-containing protein [Clostridium taeniosporum]